MVAVVGLVPSLAQDRVGARSGRPGRAFSARRVAQIAGQLVLREGTVHSHVSATLGKLLLASRTQAALYAL